MSFTITPLQDGLRFGSVVTGLSPSDIDCKSVREGLHQRWINDGLIVFRGSPVMPEFQIALSSLFGAPEVHPIPELRDSEHEELITFISDQERAAAR